MWNIPVLDTEIGGRNVSLEGMLLIALKTEVVRSSETMANFYRPTRYHTLQNIQLYEHCREELD